MELHLLCEVVELLIVVNMYGCLGCGFCLCFYYDNWQDKYCKLFRISSQYVVCCCDWGSCSRTLSCSSVIDVWLLQEMGESEISFWFRWRWRARYWWKWGITRLHLNFIYCSWISWEVCEVSWNDQVVKVLFPPTPQKWTISSSLWLFDSKSDNSFIWRCWNI